MSRSVIPVKDGIGKDRKEEIAVVVLAVAQCALEIGEAPAADAVLAIRRDVRAVENAEGRASGRPPASGVPCRFMSVWQETQPAAAKI